MTSRCSRFELPLLAKELAEQAARPRTYLVRVIYAGLSFAIAWLYFEDLFRMSLVTPMAVLGSGSTLFEQLVKIQFAGIHIFMPALACATITQEKERNSLGQLFLTRVGPWAIIFEKMLSRLVPMLSFLLLSLPLFTICYTLGGIDQKRIWMGLWYALIVTVQLAAMSVMCSAWCRSTVGAFVLAYVCEVLSFFVCCAGVITATVFFYPGPTGTTFWLFVGFQCLPVYISTVMFLLLARFFLVRRAFIQPKDRLLQFYRWLDDFFFRVNDKLTGGVVLLREKVGLPADEPVAWREISKRSLGTVRYMFRAFVVIELPLLAFCLLGVAADSATVLHVTMFIVWVLAVLVVVVRASVLIASERSKQTLDVLLTTPLSCQEIVVQKMGGVLRVARLLMIPLLSTALIEAYMRRGLAAFVFVRSELFDAPLYMACSVLACLIYLPMFAWLAMWIGLRVQTHGRALLATITVSMVWFVLPVFFFPAVRTWVRKQWFWWGQSPVEASWLTLLSPSSMLAANELGLIHTAYHSRWLVLIVNFVLYAVLLRLFRALAIRRAARALGRADVPRPRATPRTLEPGAELAAEAL